jgi:hypothetical protein
MMLTKKLGAEFIGTFWSVPYLTHSATFHTTQKTVTFGNSCCRRYA